MSAPDRAAADEKGSDAARAHLEAEVDAVLAPYAGKLSPAEMTEDPMFHDNPNLGDVESLRMATQRVTKHSTSKIIRAATARYFHNS